MLTNFFLYYFNKISLLIQYLISVLISGAAAYIVNKEVYGRLLRSIAKLKPHLTTKETTKKHDINGAKNIQKMGLETRKNGNQLSSRLPYSGINAADYHWSIVTGYDGIFLSHLIRNTLYPINSSVLTQY